MKKDTPTATTPARARDDLTLPPLAADMLQRLEIHKRQTITDLAEYLDPTSRSTIKDHLRKLIAAGYVRRHGRGKATWYTLENEP